MLQEVRFEPQVEWVGVLLQWAQVATPQTMESFEAPDFILLNILLLITLLLVFSSVFLFILFPPPLLASYMGAPEALVHSLPALHGVEGSPRKGRVEPRHPRHGANDVVSIFSRTASEAGPRTKRVRLELSVAPRVAIRLRRAERRK